MDVRKDEKAAGRSAVQGLMLAVASACYMPSFMYFSNAGEAKFLDVCPFLLAFGAGAAALMLLASLYTKDLWKSAVIAATAALIFTNYALLERAAALIPIHLRYWHIVSIVLFIFGHVVYLVKEKLSAEAARSTGRVMLLVVLALTLLNGVMAAPAIVEKVTYRPAAQGPDAAGGQTAQDTRELPNVYHFIFDEFSAQDVMEKYYGYSNEGFFTALEDMGFVVSYDSKNMSYATVTVLANYVNLDYVVTDEDSTAVRQDARLRNPMAALMREQGYQVKGVGAEWLGVGGDDLEVTATTQGGKTLQDLILDNTPLYILNVSDQTEMIKTRNRVFEHFSDAGRFLSDIPQYTMAYLECPHEPFLFNEDGTMANPKNYYNWEDPECYLAQYKYISKRIVETVENIVENDPSAIIILQSDHSARWMSAIQAEDKTHILNAVYYGGERFDEFVGKSGVNTLRTICGSLFQIDLPDVEVVE